MFVCLFVFHIYRMPLVTKHPVNIPKEISQKTKQSFSSWLKLTVNKYMIQLLQRGCLSTLCYVLFSLTLQAVGICYSIVLTTDPVLKNRPLLPLTLLFLGFLLLFLGC